VQKVEKMVRQEDARTVLFVKKANSSKSILVNKNQMGHAMSGSITSTRI
jgi:hypothetical protein